jgi:hypothetical protein
MPATTASSISSKIKRKRKREVQEEEMQPKTADNAGQPAEEREGRKKNKRKRTKQITEDSKDSLKKGGVDESIGKMDGRLLADFFVQQAKRHNNELTTLELDDIYIPGKTFYYWFKGPG